MRAGGETDVYSVGGGAERETVLVLAGARDATGTMWCGMFSISSIIDGGGSGSVMLKQKTRNDGSRDSRRPRN